MRQPIQVGVDIARFCYDLKRIMKERDFKNEELDELIKYVNEQDVLQSIFNEERHIDISSVKESIRARIGIIKILLKADELNIL